MDRVRWRRALPEAKGRINTSYFEALTLIKTDMGDEGHMGGYTQKNEIYLSADEAEYLTRTVLRLRGVFSRKQIGQFQ